MENYCLIRMPSMPKVYGLKSERVEREGQTARAVYIKEMFSAPTNSLANKVPVRAFRRRNVGERNGTGARNRRRSVEMGRKTKEESEANISGNDVVSSNRVPGDGTGLPGHRAVVKMLAET
ncbi:hypothetical protein J6590_039165 [Homalodisca vitripennis]|nr:hypothetical protein J6590_039165 [Homalodisca vitripennis]